MRRRNFIAIGVLSACVAASVGTVAYQYHSADAQLSRLHAENASPETMTRIYLQGAEHGDCILTRRLTTAHTGSWCAAPFTWLNGEPELVSHRGVGKAESVSEGVADRNQVCVASTIDQRGMSGEEPGTMSWSWCWIRTADGWRLWDQGQG